MEELQNGSLVQHATLGVGKIVALEVDAVHVFFPGSEKRFAAKLRLPAARALLRTEGFERNPWLEGLSAFTLDRKEGRYALASSWLTHEEAVEQFLAAYPRGFDDPAYLGEGKGARASRWRAAHEAWTDVLGKGEGERLVAGHDMDEIVKRILRVAKVVAAIQPPADEDAVKEALSGEETTGPFCVALLELLSVPSPGRARFDKLFAAARNLPVDPDQQWLVATIFPFLAAPARHVLLRPRVTCEAAERLGFDLRYDDSPGWATYAALRAVSTQLLGQLKAIGAKDFVDVEGFLHVTAAAKRRVKRSPR